MEKKISHMRCVDVYTITYWSKKLQPAFLINFLNNEFEKLPFYLEKVKTE